MGRLAHGLNGIACRTREAGGVNPALLCRLCDLLLRHFPRRLVPDRQMLPIQRVVQKRDAYLVRRLLAHVTALGGVL